jgi:glycosyltransferase involved in cell wall biosynthesis
MSSCSHESEIDFSVCIACYFEEKSIVEFHRRLSTTLKGLNRTFEIIFVNDGSRDATWQQLKEIFATDAHVHAILDLFKNSGQQAAVTAGLNESRGKAMVFIDSDLQLAPEDLPLLVEQYDKGFDFVTGYRQERKDSLFRIIPSRLANIVMRRASKSRIRDFGCTFKIVNSKLVRSFEYGPQRILSMVELISRVDRIAEVPVSHFPRRYGSSGWTFSKLMKYNVDNVVILSERPYQAAGLICLAASALLALRLILYKFWPVQFLPQVSNGLLLNALVISLLINVGLFSMTGEFVIRTFFRLNRAPLYSIRERIIR